MSEQPGRYQRSASGMIGALLVLLLGIGAFVGFRALNREELVVRPDAVDYRSAVVDLQAADQEIVYPATLPEGWRATSVDVVPGRSWGIGFLTPGGFAGVQQSSEPVEELLTTYVDEDPAPLPDADLGGEVAETWQAWEDAGGDLAYAAGFEDQTVLVYGSATRAELEGLARSLTTDPVEPES